MTTDQFITCNECQTKFVKALEERPMPDAVVDIGLECPMCHTWYHGFYTTPKLQDKQALLKKFKAKASKSNKHFQRYRRKKAEFAQAFDRLQQSVKAKLAPAGGV